VPALDRAHGLGSAFEHLLPGIMRQTAFTDGGGKAIVEVLAIGHRLSFGRVCGRCDAV
jgi:hypothetical protein